MTRPNILMPNTFLFFFSFFCLDTVEDDPVPPPCIKDRIRLQCFDFSHSKTFKGLSNSFFIRDTQFILRRHSETADVKTWTKFFAAVKLCSCPPWPTRPFNFVPSKCNYCNPAYRNKVTTVVLRLL